MHEQIPSPVCHIVIPAPDFEQAKSFYEQVGRVSVVCISIGAALWACLGCAGNASRSSSQTMGAQDSGLVDCLVEISDTGGEPPNLSFVSGNCPRSLGHA